MMSRSDTGRCEDGSYLSFSVIPCLFSLSNRYQRIHIFIPGRSHVTIPYISCEDYKLMVDIMVTAGDFGSLEQETIGVQIRHW